MKKDESKSAGGLARAAALNEKERSKIASKGALAKWSKPKAKFGSPDKKLKIGERELECYVLEDGRRVLSGRGFQEALGLGQSHGALLSRFVEQKAIISYINNDLAMALSEPIRFIRPGRGGKLAAGFEAKILPDLCDAVLEARNQDSLTTERQAAIASQCEVIVRALSRVGIDALVDEVTGYQEVRDRDALQKILDKYITDEYAKWSHTFPDEFYKELFRLKGLEWPAPNGRKPQYVGHWTNSIIYDRLAPGVKEELKRKNPRTLSGSRKRKHHQHLTKDFGHPELKELLNNVIFLMRASSDWDSFTIMLDKAKAKYGNTIEMNLEG